MRAGLLKIAGVEATHECVIVQGSGTFAVEASVGSSVPRGGRALVVTNGSYGQRIATIAKRLEIDTTELAFEWNDVGLQTAPHPR